MTRKITVLFLALAFMVSMTAMAAAEVYENYPPHIVKKVQIHLNQMGYGSGPVDGLFGPKTRRALRAYQRANNLPVSGSLNIPTIRSLGLPPPPGYQGRW